MNDMMNKDDLRCLFCAHLEYHITDFSVTYNCNKSRYNINCEKFITKENYIRRKKLDKIYDVR